MAIGDRSGKTWRNAGDGPETGEFVREAYITDEVINLSSGNERVQKYFNSISKSVYYKHNPPPSFESGLVADFRPSDFDGTTWTDSSGVQPDMTVYSGTPIRTTGIDGKNCVKFTYSSDSVRGFNPVDMPIGHENYTFICMFDSLNGSGIGAAGLVPFYFRGLPFQTVKPHIYSYQDGAIPFLKALNVFSAGLMKVSLQNNQSGRRLRAINVTASLDIVNTDSNSKQLVSSTNSFGVNFSIGNGPVSIYRFMAWNRTLLDSEVESVLNIL